MKKIILFLSSLFISFILNAQTYVDEPFIQDYADKFEWNDEGNNNDLLQVKSDRNGGVKILSSTGVLQAYDKKIVNDLQYKFLSDLQIISIEVYENQFVYLTDKAILSNAWAGKFYIEHGINKPEKFIVGSEFSTLVIGPNQVKLFKQEKEVLNESIKLSDPLDLLYDQTNNRFLILTNSAVYQLDNNTEKLERVFEGDGLTALALYKNQIVLGTKNGILSLNRNTFSSGALNQKLPFTEITTVENINGRLWFGSTKGAFKLRANIFNEQTDAKYDYFASKRWLVDDVVIDISKGPENSILILTKKGMSKINFVSMTLAEKAEHFQKIQRLRHIRFGFTSATKLETPGDLSSTVLEDTDNDGLWTSMYLAGELFRYAVTKSEDAKLNAYEAFEAMERLTEIPGLDGFPARTYEIDGYVSSDGSNGISGEELKEWEAKNGDTWRLTEDERWRWKSTTSSDESCGHFFAYALFAELAPDKEWRDRAIHQIKIEMDHIIENDWYLVSWNGKPTVWGKWNPEYVNDFPINVGDRRLNATLILAFLQTAYHYTHDEKYKNAAYDLIEKHGYDDNANRPASIIGYEEGENLSDAWNHSDDEMYFLTIPAFVNYSFSKKEKKKHFEAAKSHWEIERSEKNPLWNYLFALSGGKDIDIEESAWWLREFPMDLIDWEIDNSQREDLIKIEPNFRNQTYNEVLPPDERVLGLHNGAYRNNGGSDGRREYDPYIYLLPYWAGRYVNAISTPDNK
ncbi:MAG: hypothetical protein KAH25_00625 [Bacteroidales bacterium]|nr:hypothetical protein [Bacteroidales bacterium]